MGEVISIANQKGGIGKTTISFNLAKELARRDYKVLAIDNDPQGNLSLAILPDLRNLKANLYEIYRVDNAIIEPQQIVAGLDFIGADIRLAKMAEQTDDIIYRLSEYLDKIKDRYDYIVIDCLPSFGYIMKAALKAADFVIIPIKPSPFALMGLTDLIDTVEKIKRRINPKLDILGIVINLIEGRTTALANGLQETIREHYREMVFSMELTKGVKYEESIMYKQSITEYAPDTKWSKNFSELTDEILARLKERG